MFKKKKARTSFREVFRKGSFTAKLSFLIIGAAGFTNKQWLKGIIFLAAGIGFTYWLIRSGFYTLMMLGALGTRQQGLVCDDSLGIEALREGGSSMLLLLFGIAAILVCLLPTILCVINLRSTHRPYGLKTADKKILTTMGDLRSLLNERFYTALMTISLPGVPFFTILPLLYMISIVFTNYDHNHLPPRNLFTWAGLVSLGNIIAGDIASTFFPVPGWTLIWAAFATATCFFFGITLTLLINTKGLKYKALWQTILVITVAVPPFVSLLITQNLLNDSGPTNVLLLSRSLIGSPIPFSADPNWTKLIIIIVNMRIDTPATVLTSMGITQNLPEDQIETVRINSANKWQISKSITSPQILLAVTSALIQQLIGSINNFNVIYLLTGGGLANSNFYGADSTDLLVTRPYKLTVGAMDYNLASVISILILILSAVFSLIAYTRMNPPREA